jgi:hypothetical protein
MPQRERESLGHSEEVVKLLGGAARDAAVVARRDLIFFDQEFRTRELRLPV